MKLGNLLSNLTLNSLPTGLSSRLINRSGYNLLARQVYNNALRNRIRVNQRTGTIQTVNNRRSRRTRKGIQGLEINRAEGGFKNIANPRYFRNIGVNIYGRVIIVKIGNNWQYQLAPELDNYAGVVRLDVTSLLNKSEEFINWCQNSSQYQVRNIAFTFDYSRIPESKDRLSKMLLFYTTDKVKIQKPKLETNVMSISMTQPGVKNFNIRLGTNNTSKLSLGWQDSDYLFAGNFILEIDSQDSNHIQDDTETMFILGTFKITVNVLFRLQDYQKMNPPRKLLTIQQVRELVTQDNDKSKQLEIQRIEHL